VQIPSDITFFADPDGEALSPLLTLAECGVDTDSGRAVLFVQSRGERFGSRAGLD
jgi:hypothetical protein